MSRHGGRRFAGKDADRGAGGATVPRRRTPMSDERAGGRWVAERLFDRIGLRMTFAAGRVLDERRTPYQQLLLFEHRHSPARARPLRLVPRQWASRPGAEASSMRPSIWRRPLRTRAGDDSA